MNKPQIHLSIMPSFYCNYNCNYCYLGNLRKDRKILNLNILEQKLKEISLEYNIHNTVIYGGEISLLNKDYVKSLVDVCKNNNVIPSFVSNLSNDWLIKYCDDNNFHLSISLNKERPHYNETLNKIKTLNKQNKDLSVVVLPSLLKKDVKELMEMYNKIGLDVLFIQYHQSNYSLISNNINYHIDINNYSNFLRNIIEEKHKNKYDINIINEIFLNDDNYNPLASGFIFINPDGNYMTVEYINNIEYYKSFENLNDWKYFCKKEYEQYFNKCSLCELFGKCKAEHLEIIDKKECSGLYNLVKWYKGKKWN